MRIQHNIMAMNAYRNLGMNNKALSKNLEKLSSGYKINRAGDDAAGLAISEKMRAQIAGLEQAQKNAQSGINLVQTAEGAMTEIHDMLNRMVTLTTQAANGTYTNEDRTKLENEVTALKEEIDRIADNANFNGTKLLDGTLGKGDVGIDAASDIKKGEAIGDTVISEVRGNLEEGTYTLAVAGNEVTVSLEKDDGSVEVSTFDLTDWAADFDGVKGAANRVTLGDFSIEMVNTDAETGADIVAALNGLTIVGEAAAGGVATDGLALQIGASAEEQITVNVNSMKVEALGLNSMAFATVEDAQNNITIINSAIEEVSSQRALLGATQNRLEHTINNLGVMTENIQDAESTIRDTDVAEEMMKYTKNNILIQSAQAMLAQANQVPQGVLQLLQ